MSSFSYIFIFYIIISLLRRIGNKKRRSYSLTRKEEDNPISVFSEIQDEAGLPGDKINIKQINNIEKKDKMIIDDEVKEFYKNKGKDNEQEILNKKAVVEVEDREEIASGRESGLEIYLSDNILIDGVILSEIIALPRALRPYNFQRYKGLR
ncbi:MAG: hypothetical protein MUO55_03570 [Candidatus Atribacteria bacterium]|nr:hypothetical protein [Candidatus Atribacteria bacterium]